MGQGLVAIIITKEQRLAGLRSLEMGAVFELKPMLQKLLAVGADQLVLMKQVSQDPPVFDEGVVDVANQVVVTGIALVVEGVPADIITILFV